MPGAEQILLAGQDAGQSFEQVARIAVSVKLFLDATEHGTVSGQVKKKRNDQFLLSDQFRNPDVLDALWTCSAYIACTRIDGRRWIIARDVLDKRLTKAIRKP